MARCVATWAHCLSIFSLRSGDVIIFVFFFQAEDGIRDDLVTGVQTCALPILVHIAHGDHAGSAAELGLSVLDSARGMGIGNALFARATMHLRNRAVREVIIHCLSENAAMLHLAHKHGMQLLRDGTDSEARLTLPPATSETIMLEWLQDQQASYIGTVRENAKLA